MKPFLLLLWMLLAGVALGDERILSFHSRIEVGRDGRLEVTETIRVNSEGQEIKRGIFRDFPELYVGRWGMREERPFEVIGALLDGREEAFATEAHLAGTRVRIGRASVFLDPGEHTYPLRYRTSRQLAFFETHDELYWNVTGSEWMFPIDAASAEVILPVGIAIRSMEGYQGPKGSTDAAVASGPEGNRAGLESGRMLEPGEGLTLVATWPARALDEAAYAKPALLADNPMAVIGLLLLVVMMAWHLFAWVLVGRDPAPGVIIPQFGPPEGFSPAAVRMLDRMAFDNTCFSAAVMGLGVKGVLKIGGTGDEYELERVEGADISHLTPDELALYEKLLGARRSLVLEQSNHKVVAAGRKVLQSKLANKLEKSHFFRNAIYWVPGLLLGLAGAGLVILNLPEMAAVGFIVFFMAIWSVGTGALVSAVISRIKSGKLWSSIPLALFSLPFVIGWIFGAILLYVSAGLLVTFSFVFVIVVNFLFYHWIKAPTHLGRRSLDHIEGFKRYLAVAEEDRLGAFAGPEKTPELFEMFLPYAHALGVEQKWSVKFKDVLERAGTGSQSGSGGYQPGFYSGGHRNFTGAMSAAALGGALTSSLTSASTSPSTSSGSGGGGSSGGGGGGGGGGGW